MLKYMKDNQFKQPYDYLYFSELSSTNDYAKDNYQNFTKPTVILAAKQTAGRGRTGHKWISDEGTLTMSIVIKNDFCLLDEDLLSKITLIVGIAVNKVLNKTIHTKDSVLIKWPNDQIYQNKKIAGILAEAVTMNNAVQVVAIGIGINVNTPTEDYKIEGNNTITSIKAITKMELNLKMFSHIIAMAVLDEIASCNKSLDLEYLNEKNYLKNKEVTFMKNGKEESGLVLKINDKGSLEVIKNNNIYEIKSGEVSLIR